MEDFIVYTIQMQSSNQLEQYYQQILTRNLHKWDKITSEEIADIVFWSTFLLLESSSPVVKQKVLIFCKMILSY